MVHGCGATLGDGGPEYIHDHLSRGAVIWAPDPIRDFIAMPLPE
jgi:hypothetical protein